MIPLAADGSGQRAEHVVSVPQAVENVPEIEAGRPAELLPSALIDVDAIDTWEHSPTSQAIRLLVVRKQALHHCRCILGEA
jgi:hypothetical protein